MAWRRNRRRQRDRPRGIGTVVLTGEDDDLGVRRDRQNLFEQRNLSNGVRVGGKPDPSSPGRLIPAHQLQRTLPVVRGQRFAYWSKAQRICFCSARSSSTMSRCGKLYGAHSASFVVSAAEHAPHRTMANSRFTLCPDITALSTDIFPAQFMNILKTLVSTGMPIPVGLVV